MRFEIRRMHNALNAIIMKRKVHLVTTDYHVVMLKSLIAVAVHKMRMSIILFVIEKQET